MLLKIKNLSTHYFVNEGILKAVDNVNMTIAEEELIGLVGETACGKSTLAYSILRLVSDPGKIVRGEIIYKGTNLLELSEEEMNNIRGKEISMIFQSPQSFLNPKFTIEDQIGSILELHQKKKRASLRKEICEHLKMVDLPDPENLLGKHSYELSGGMAQRTMIVMALSCRPSLLIADEPTTSLDVTTQAQILKLLRNLQKEIGLSALYITHNLGVVAEICDKMNIMYAGEIIESGDVSSIFQKPRHPYTEKLIESVPKLDSNVKKFTTIPGNVPDLIRDAPGCKFYPRCEFRQEICSQEKPELTEIEKGHFVACLDPLNG